VLNPIIIYTENGGFVKYYGAIFCELFVNSQGEC